MRGILVSSDAYLLLLLEKFRCFDPLNSTANSKDHFEASLSDRYNFEVFKPQL
jgi:hypothetical protein